MKRNLFRATERILVDAGYRQAYTPREDVPVIRVEESKLAKIRKRQKIRPEAVRTKKVQQQPGLTEVELLRLLQEHGIGRPATYAGIIAALLQRKYVIQGDDGVLHVTERGKQVCAFLTAEYPRVFSPDFTSRMEARLDAIENGKTSYQNVVETLWQQLQRKGEV